MRKVCSSDIGHPVPTNCYPRLFIQEILDEDTFATLKAATGQSRISTAVAGRCKWSRTENTQASTKVPVFRRLDGGAVICAVTVFGLGAWLTRYYPEEESSPDDLAVAASGPRRIAVMQIRNLNPFELARQKGLRNIARLDYLGLIRNQDGLFGDLTEDPRYTEIIRTIEESNARTRRVIQREMPHMLDPASLQF